MCKNPGCVEWKKRGGNTTVKLENSNRNGDENLPYVISDVNNNEIIKNNRNVFSNSVNIFNVSTC
jgi:hypothetical protein